MGRLNEDADSHEEDEYPDPHKVSRTKSSHNPRTAVHGQRPREGESKDGSKSFAKGYEDFCAREFNPRNLERRPSHPRSHF